MTNNNQIQSSFIATIVRVGVVAGAALGDPDLDEKLSWLMGSAYRLNYNAPTYSQVGSPITGAYLHANHKLNIFRVTPEAQDFLAQSSDISSASLDDLVTILRKTYGDVQMEMSLHKTPEEDWVKPVISVHSGIEDFDKLLEIEDNFFAAAEDNSNLKRILSFVVISLT